MADVLLQYLGPAYKQRLSAKEPRLGRSSYHFDQEIEELWKLVPDVPKQLAGILLECLPGGDKRSPIPHGILESLDEENLAFLLRRDDIELGDLRRKFYADSSSEKLRRAAVASIRFDLLDSDISRLVSNLNEHEESRPRQVEELNFLAKYCRGARLVQMEAMHHYLCRWKSNYCRTDEGDALQSERAKRLWNGGSGRLAFGEEVLQLRVFELAKLLSPLDSDEAPSVLPKSLKQHLKLILPQNPWQTYLNLWDSVDLLNGQRRTKIFQTSGLGISICPDEFSQCSHWWTAHQSCSKQPISSSSTEQNKIPLVASVHTCLWQAGQVETYTAELAFRGPNQPVELALFSGKYRLCSVNCLFKRRRVDKQSPRDLLLRPTGSVWIDEQFGSDTRCGN